MSCINRQNTSHLLLAALSNGEVRLYREGGLLNTFKVDGPVMGMRFGHYGREDNTLCVVHSQVS